MKKKIMIFIQIILWIIALIPVIYVMKECIYAFFYGTYHGFNPNGKIYGVAAFVDLLMTIIAFQLLLFLIWFLWLVGTILFTIKCNKNK